MIYATAGAAPEEVAYTWVDARDLNREDISTLCDEYGISNEFLVDVMDPDEQSRIEKDEDKVNIILRVPILFDDDEEDDSNSQVTVPLGIVLMGETVITICQADSVVLQDLAKNRFRHYPIETKEGFVLSILGRATQVFLRLLKLVNRQKNQVEERLSGVSIKNYELVQLLNIQKTLVYYSTGLTMNQALMEKLLKTNLFIMNNQDERDFLDDVIIDNAQALSMAKIYSNILTVTTDSFASVISNNMNIIMKRLTLISLMLMFPTLITSFYGMNVKLPFANNPLSWLFLLGLCLLVCVGSLWGLSNKRDKKILDKENADRDREKEKIDRKELALMKKKRVKELKKKKREERKDN